MYKEPSEDISEATSYLWKQNRILAAKMEIWLGTAWVLACQLILSAF